MGILWPSDQRFDRELSHRRISDGCIAFSKLCSTLDIGNLPVANYTSYYIPFAAWLNECRRLRNGPVVIGVCGAQGSGKSTLCDLLSDILCNVFDRQTVTLSIDDLYLTKEQRIVLSQTHHPLFRTRGVPMTHDVALGLRTIRSLKNLEAGTRVALPRFDKSIDTRADVDKWPIATQPIDIILFEGWCVGARAQSAKQLLTDVNSLETFEDADHRWRTAVNFALSHSYQELFAMIDHLILLAVEDFANVINFRQHQEHQLAAKVRADGRSHEPLSIMSDDEVVRFISHYERLTRHILMEMPERADIVIQLDDKQRTRQVAINKPLV